MRVMFGALLLTLFTAGALVGCGEAETSQKEIRVVKSTKTLKRSGGESPSASSQSQGNSQSVDEAGVHSNGCVFGRLTYQSDSTRPWRYGRYYINKKNGELSGAIVCLSSRALKKYSKDKEEPKTWKMDQKNFEFLPEVLAIRAGDEVRFVNSDKASHNVHASGNYDSFNIMTPVGKSLTRKFSHAGNDRNPVSIQCDLHSQMQAWIFVFGHPFHQLTGPSGQFEFRGVPAGEYDLVAIHPAGQLRSRQKIRIVGGKKSTVEVVLSPDNLKKKSESK